MKTVSIIQSSYIPWIGLFDIIRQSDVFVFLDDVQYTRRDWRNRNFIANNGKPKILTIPVKSKGQYYANIDEILICDDTWVDSHLNLIKEYYRTAKNFKEVFELFNNIFENVRHYNKLSDINESIITQLSNFLHLETQFHKSTEFNTQNNKTGRLLDICRSVGADYYISGPAAKDYLEVEKFYNAGIDVIFFQYNTYTNVSIPDDNSTRNMSIVHTLMHTENPNDPFQ